MFERVKAVIGIALFLAFFPLMVVLKVLLTITGQDKADLSREEVLDYLRRMDAGEVDDYGWDNFVNVPLKDAELDEIRERCSEIWEDAMNEYLISDEDLRLNEKGREEIKRLIEQCEAGGA